MAIVKCPECNGNISDKSKQCVHCGCPLTVCPECNSVFSKEIQTCPGCGYELIEPQAEVSTESLPLLSKNEEINEEIKKGDYIKAWKISNPFAPFILKHPSLIRVISFIIGTILLVFFPRFYFSYLTENNPIELLAEFEKYLNQIYLGIGFGCFLVSFGISFDHVIAPYKTYSFSNFLYYMRIDCTEKIKQSLNAIKEPTYTDAASMKAFTKQQQDFNFLSQAAALKTDLVWSCFFIMTAVIKIIVNIVFGIVFFSL